VKRYHLLRKKDKQYNICTELATEYRDKNQPGAELYRISRVSLYKSDVGPCNGRVQFQRNEKIMIRSCCEK